MGVLKIEIPKKLCECGCGEIIEDGYILTWDDKSDFSFNNTEMATIIYNKLCLYDKMKNERELKYPKEIKKQNHYMILKQLSEIITKTVLKELK